MIVLDTHVLSELMRRQPDPAVLAWFDAQLPDELMLSAVTLAELASLCYCPAARGKAQGGFARYGAGDVQGGIRRTHFAV